MTECGVLSFYDRATNNGNNAVAGLFPPLKSNNVNLPHPVFQVFAG